LHPLESSYSEPVENAVEENLKVDWIVKLHPDSGQAFYVDSSSHLSTWANPFEVGLGKEIFEKITFDQESGKIPMNDAEKLAGFDEGTLNVFHSDYVEVSKSRLSDWIERKRLYLSEDYAAMLNYPEYFHLPHFISPIPPKQPHFLIHSSRTVAGKADAEISSFTFRISLVETVRSLMTHFIKRFNKGNPAQAYGDSEADCCIFKVAGFHEYILHMDFPLGAYECAVNAANNEVLVNPF
jgi:hypothetical protein